MKLNKYHYALTFLLIFTTYAAFFDFTPESLINPTIAVFTAGILDLAINFYKHKKIKTPFSAKITGLLIGGILGYTTAPELVILTVVIAILSKHIIIYRGRNIFNPAAFGIVVGGLTLGVFNSWWISSPPILIILLGLIIAWKIDKLEIPLTFLIIFYLAEFALFGKIMSLEKIAADAPILLFAFFMLLEPKTSPYGKNAKIVYGVIVAVLFLTLTPIIPQYDILTALLIGNLLNPVITKYLK